MPNLDGDKILDHDCYPAYPHYENISSKKSHFKEHSVILMVCFKILIMYIQFYERKVLHDD